MRTRLKSLFYISKKFEYVGSFLLILGDIIHSLISKTKRMNAKMLVGGLLGGVTFFLLGYVLYGLLFSDALAACTTCQRPMEEINFLLLGVGNLFVGLTISYIFSRWASVSTFMGGATAGATIGLLMSIGFNSIGYATSTVYSSATCILYSVLIEVIMWGVVGGIIAWWLGRK
jgi:hypothetical protein